MLGRVTGNHGLRAAAFFDLDKTVIAKSSTLAFSRPFFRNGLINRRAVLKGAYAQFVFAEAADLIEEHRAAGREIVIVSSSGAEMVEPIGELLGVDRVVATRMVTVDGRYTGEIDFYAYGENKAEAMRQLAEESGYDLADCYAYSDSITDLPMLEAVGHPHAVTPDKELRRIAAERGWPILVFTRPVTLGSRLPPARSALAALALGGVGAVGWVLWSSARRRRQSA